MYSPLIEAFNYALDRLSELKVPGLPEFQETRRVVFARSDAKCIKSESYLQGSYKPDIVLLKWDVSKSAHQSDSESHRPDLRWYSVLSTVEVKRGENRNKGKAKEKSTKSTDTNGFWDLRGDSDSEASRLSTIPQSVPPKMVNEEYPTRLRMFLVFLCLSSHFNQSQFRHALA